MAKRKTALFEVFQGMQKKASAPPPIMRALRVPRWWHRRKAQSDGASFAPVVSEPAATTTAIERFLPAREVHTETAPSRPGVRVSVDSTDQTISLVLSYSSAAVACFTVVVLVGMAYVVGKHTSRGPLPLLAEKTTEEVRRDKPRADVLNLAKDSGNEPITPTPVQPLKSPTKKASLTGPAAPTTGTGLDTHRTIGWNYVIVQSYPDEKDAINARDILIKHGIFCTVEPAPANWTQSSWKMYSVIGLTGFDRVRNSPEFENYKAAIIKVSDEYAGRSKFKRFDPSAYKWREVK
jgi:hypothetical protein